MIARCDVRLLEADLRRVRLAAPQECPGFAGQRGQFLGVVAADVFRRGVAEQQLGEAIRHAVRVLAEQPTGRADPGADGTLVVSGTLGGGLIVHGRLDVRRIKRALGRTVVVSRGRGRVVGFRQHSRRQEVPKSQRKTSNIKAKPGKPAVEPQTARDDIDITALSLQRGKLSPAMVAYFAKCAEKLGFVPNVLSAYAFDNAKLEAFVNMYNDLMLAPSGLSKLEREMIAVAVSSANRCYYCLVAHGAAVRALSGDPALGELMVMNYRAAHLSKRQRAMLDFATKLTAEPWSIEESDREALRKVGFSERDIWDIAAVAGFYNMSNRVASATDMRPNSVYHGLAR